MNQNDEGAEARSDRHRRDVPVGGETDSGRRPGAHPEVKRSGISRSTVIGLVIALALGGLLYAAITIGISASGA